MTKCSKAVREATKDALYIKEISENLEGRLVLIPKGKGTDGTIKCLLNVMGKMLENMFVARMMAEVKAEEGSRLNSKISN